MDDVVVLEGAHHLADGVGLADGGEELVAEPSPCEAPRTRPAMSTNVTVAGTIGAPSYSAASWASRWSGTATTPTLGSIVANG